MATCRHYRSAAKYRAYNILHCHRENHLDNSDANCSVAIDFRSLLYVFGHPEAATGDPSSSANHDDTRA
jgi:hypothetical protein